MRRAADTARVALLALAVLALPVVAAGAPTPAAPPSPPAGRAASQARAPAATAGTSEQPTLGDDRDVIEASEKWLRLLDRGQMGAAWDASAKSLQDQVSRAEWVKGIGAARKPFGTLKARKRDRFARAHQMPGGPEGDYAIVQFVSEFDNGQRATEQLIWMLQPDGGIWRVSGYHIR